MFGFTVWLVIGGIVGWIASVVTRTDEQQAILGNIIVGVVGAYIGGAFIAPMARATLSLAHPFALFGALVAVALSVLARRAMRR